MEHNIANVKVFTCFQIMYLQNLLPPNFSHIQYNYQYVLCILQYKCQQYWPNSGFKQYGNIKVTAENKVQFANYCVRSFSVEHVSVT